MHPFKPGTPGMGAETVAQGPLSGPAAFPSAWWKGRKVAQWALRYLLRRSDHGL